MDRAARRLPGAIARIRGGDVMAEPPAGMRIVDAHVHLFPPDVLANRERYAARDAFFGYLYGSSRAAMVTPERLLADMDRDGVAEAVVVGWPWQRHDVCVEHNAWVIETVAASGGRLRGLATVQPTAGAEALRELGRCVESGLVGVGELNADGQGFRLDDAQFLDLARSASEAGLPLLLHANEPVGHAYPGKGTLGMRQIYDLIRAVPTLTLVLAHWGGGFPFYEMMPEVRRAAANVCYDSAASPLLYEPSVFPRVAGMVGAEKILFGTDYPLLLEPKRQKGPGFAGAIAQVTGLGLDVGDQGAILGGNAARVYAVRSPHRQ